ncbi:winged helix-turn-helix domain-containing protein [Pseudomonas sp. LPB0260]|uniref:winged helix-turn-helix domain-containing protein n=1 Tax=Pseudomonas sp. LPB0260 TaxID=2614442 RepID=UPI0015C24B20|nr:winged helix-turn-helix domain-containing protein [Pseudomonas sp. LPB0260]QLC74717.1 winged helix-turn-helix domain-containing protein [Pseudomonas sp. LPB0260]
MMAEELCPAFYTALFPVDPVRVFDLAVSPSGLDPYKAAVVEVDAAADLKRALEIISAIRGQSPDVRILALAKKPTVDARVQLYLAGVDTCLALPASAAVIADAFAKLVDESDSGAVPVLDLRQLCLWTEQEQVQLSYFELRVLGALSRARGRIARREEIVDLLEWSPDGYDQRALEKFISRLRAKTKTLLGSDAIQSIRGYGYRLSSRLAIVGADGI